MNRKQIVLGAIVLVVGIFLGMFLAGKLFHPGCKLSFKFWPPAIDIDCSSAPFETTINFGSNASERSLASALSILADLTRDKANARVYFNPDVLNSDFAKNTKVHPPSGAQGTIAALRQLLADANAQEKVDICVIPSGIRVQLRR